RIPQIVAALVAGRYLKEAPASSERYEPAVVEAIKRFQTQQGVNDDGVIGGDTIAILNAGPADRARQLALNLEVRRWLKRNPAATRIDVNTAAAVMTTYENGKIIDVRRVVVGKPDAATPNLAGTFSDLVLNPPWNVPQGIAEREILPKGAAYLREHDMYLDEGRVVQRPGPKASLGRVKFDMQNPHAIYLHDTPSKRAFAANERHGSHGCVRVDDAVGYARGLSSAAGLQSEFDAKLAKGATAVLGLQTPMPVRLMYQTAFVDRSGEIAFRPDIYGWDERLATALGMPAPMKRETRASDVDVGP
ncbi:L,D-transpeptidase family protein, partial [Phenylobacterium sp.]